MPEPCADCGRSPEAGETWQVMHADALGRGGFAMCPECAERFRRDNESSMAFRENLAGRALTGVLGDRLPPDEFVPGTYPEDEPLYGKTDLIDWLLNAVFVEIEG